MKIFKNILGSKAQAIPVVVNVDTVYVHSNIQKLETDLDGNPTDNLYQYDEIQYTKDEYIQLMADRQNIEAQFTTELDLNVQDLQVKQKVESTMTTQHDMDILGLMDEIQRIKEALKSNGINI